MNEKMNEKMKNEKKKETKETYIKMKCKFSLFEYS